MRILFSNSSINLESVRDETELIFHIDLSFISIGNQSLLEQILADRVPQEQVTPDADNWFETILNSAHNLFSLLYALTFP